MSQLSFVIANAQEEMIQKRVKSLKFQLKALGQKNTVLQQKIKDVNRANLDHTKSPVSQLQENLHFDRRQVIELFKPIIAKEAIYIRNERFKSEQFMMQSKLNEIQQKKIRARQIEQFDADAIRRVAEFKEKKVTEIRQRNVTEIEINKSTVLRKLEHISVLENEEKELMNMIQQAKLNTTQLQQRFSRAITQTDESSILPNIRKFSCNQRFESPFKNRTPNHYSDKFLDHSNTSNKKQPQYFLCRRQSKSTNKLNNAQQEETNGTPQWAIQFKQYYNMSNKENFEDKEDSQEQSTQQ
ncbi:unnamed protein product (macronuclear) [Paramecium tetraurelia]|uniref:DUF4201 domain-containing protein n=1 Tax=Paramecium tetraurelia TaxID=5888 RepID=A0BLU2_PARTE|nr:uncharacterized protein GSPATT00030143001 [Paramecium tetraurelia]CAK59509.1 unnamed protein product [Paramecium tetraurelia]|eukprot:XP_001426907.1 hypothetical protein (macronuclear) [Paramecium tetraurelia strain d4-2]